MDRKESIKTLFIGSISLPFMKISKSKLAGEEKEKTNHNSEPMQSEMMDAGSSAPAHRPFPETRSIDPLNIDFWEIFA